MQVVNSHHLWLSEPRDCSNFLPGSVPQSIVSLPYCTWLRIRSHLLQHSVVPSERGWDHWSTFSRWIASHIAILFGAYDNACKTKNLFYFWRNEISNISKSSSSDSFWRTMTSCSLGNRHCGFVAPASISKSTFYLRKFEDSQRITSLLELANWQLAFLKDDHLHVLTRSHHRSPYWTPTDAGA